MSALHLAGYRGETQDPDKETQQPDRQNLDQAKWLRGGVWPAAPLKLTNLKKYFARVHPNGIKSDLYLYNQHFLEK